MCAVDGGYCKRKYFCEESRFELTLSFTRATLLVVTQNIAGLRHISDTSAPYGNACHSDICAEEDTTAAMAFTKHRIDEVDDKTSVGATSRRRTGRKRRMPAPKWLFFTSWWRVSNTKKTDISEGLIECACIPQCAVYSNAMGNPTSFRVLANV